MDFGVINDPFNWLPNSTSSVFAPIPEGPLWTLLVMFLSQERFFPKTKDKFKDEYDFIVVGGGTTGSVVANRLSEIPSVNVLLLEAGAEPPALSEIPAYYRYLRGTEIDWKYQTVPQLHAKIGFRDRRVVIPSGKVLGGSSVLNDLLHIRGNKHDYDDWKILGATDWGYDDVLPYFKKLQDNADYDSLDADFHSVGGPVTASRVEYNPVFKQPALDATAALGYEELDSNAARQTGVYRFQANVRNGRRVSAAKAYLVPADDRPNLDILKNAFVTKVHIKDNIAYGVEFNFGGELRTVKAKKEIILSAGAIRTPQLLMLSGIGPCEHLSQFDIPCIKDLPVGKNLHDHVGIDIVYQLNDNNPLYDIVDTSEDAINRYTLDGTGPLVAYNGIALTGFFDGVKTSHESPDIPLQQLFWTDYRVEKRRHVLEEEYYQAKYADYEGKRLYSCKVSNVQPYSRGEILLNSTDPFEYPLINPNYLLDPRDVDTLVEGWEICNAVSQRTEMKSILSEPLSTTYPNCQDHADERERIICEIQTASVPYFNFVGTARMGAADDARSVVDADLRVIGVNGLRVADGAVMPVITSGNTFVPRYMIGEKASDKIKLSYNLEVQGKESTKFQESLKFHESGKFQESAKFQESGKFHESGKFQESTKFNTNFPTVLF